MDLERFSVLTFDIVGTIINFEKGVLDSVRRLGGEVAQNVSDDSIFAAYKRGRENNPGRSSQSMKAVYLSVASELGLLKTPGLEEIFQLDVIDWPAFEDSVSSLQRLRRHFRLVAMTNADRTAYTQYANLLGNPFHDSVTFDEVGVAKPDPQFFAYNLGRQNAFGYRLDEILHVAQSQYHDIGVARDLGYKVCWIERRQGLGGFGGTPAPDRTATPNLHLGSLSELADQVDAALGVEETTGALDHVLE